MKKTFTVVSSTKSSTEGAFISKIQSYKMDELFGKMVEESLSVKGTNQMEVGKEIEVDLALFDIVEHERAFADNNGVVNKIKARWLHIKRAAQMKAAA